MNVYIAELEQMKLVALKSDSDAVNNKIEQVFAREDEELFL
jgi:hypothetical protein